jgi:transcription elongation GreA/GreB family factor
MYQFKIESILKKAVIVVHSQKSDSVVAGSEITVVKEGEKNQHKYTIVGGEESDIESGKISVNSPFGQAALGKKKDQTFTFQAPNGPITYKIIDIQ